VSAVSERARAVALALATLAAGLLVAQAVTWPDVSALASASPKTTAFIERHRERERARGRDGDVAFVPVPLARISQELQLAVLVSEDDTFPDHSGFAIAQMRAAIHEAWAEGKAPRGASTITQQLAKNLWLSPSRNPWRKVKEALLTIQLEQELTKKRILEIYLNVAEFGPGVYGAEAAARRYFSRSAAELGPHEAARLAAALPKPSKWHPGTSSAAAGRRTRIIQERMARSRWLLSRLDAAEH
jgi:monofunctional biosynthetic peptidoglycan transglycosylase